jgi:hypothetical protein
LFVLSIMVKGIQQYLPAKPTKFGIKKWEWASPYNGYCHEFIPTSSSTAIDSLFASSSNKVGFEKKLSIYTWWPLSIVFLVRSLTTLEPRLSSPPFFIKLLHTINYMYEPAKPLQYKQVVWTTDLICSGWSQNKQISTIVI